MDRVLQMENSSGTAQLAVMDLIQPGRYRAWLAIMQSVVRAQWWKSEQLASAQPATSIFCFNLANLRTTHAQLALYSLADYWGQPTYTSHLGLE